MLNTLLNVGFDYSMNTGSNSVFGGLLGGALLAMGIFLIIIFIALYVYYALVWQTIAKKLGYKKSWLAWIPIAQIALLPILAKKHWTWVFILLIPIVNIVFIFIWMWTILERRNYPGWLVLLSLLSIIPILNILVSIGWLVLMGLVAWNDR